MATYRVSLAYPTTPPLQWNFATTVCAKSSQDALQFAYNKWLAERPNPTPPALNKCRSLINQKSLIYGLNDTTTASAQEAFAASIQQKVTQAFGSQLSGPFVSLSYPAGFNYGITYGSNAYYNVATLQDLDTLLGTRPDGQLDLTTADFATTYLQILQAVTFGFSDADLKTMSDQDAKAEAQIGAVVTEFVQADGKFSNPPPFGGKIQDIINQMNKRFGSYEKMPPTLNGLRNAIATYVSLAGDSYALHNRYYAATARLNAAIANVTTPTSDNGGMQTGDSTYYVGYTPSKLPTAPQLIGSLSTTSNAIQVSVSLSSFSSSSTQVSISGEGGFDLPIADVFGLSVNASANYNMSNFTSSESTVTMDFTYPGLTFVAATPSVLSTDNSTGWYANDILAEVVANAELKREGKNVKTGYQLQGSEWDPTTTFGEGGRFARLGTFVISQQPTITMTFTNANSAAIQSALSVNASAQLDFLDIFSMGSASGSYQVQKVDNNSSSGTVTVTFGPPAVSGTIPLSAQVAYVLGGVASYPPTDI